jgi:hypothetical protein
LISAAFAQDAVYEEEVIFDPNGFWKNPTNATPYKGLSAPDIDAMWDRLLRDFN